MESISNWRLYMEYLFIDIKRLVAISFLFTFSLLFLSYSYADEEGWPVKAGDRVFSSPVIADLDGDSKSEVIISSVSAGVYVYQCNGQLASGWPKATTHEFRSSPSIGNLDGDSELEIVVCTCDRITDTVIENYVYAYNYDGTILSGFPISVTNTRITSTPAIGNISGSASPEIVVLAGDLRIYAWHTDGSIVNNYPRMLNSDGVLDSTGNIILTSSPALANTDGDEELEIFVGTTGFYFYYLDSDTHMSSYYTNDSWVLSSPAVANVDNSQNGSYEIVVGGGDGYIYAFDIEGGVITPYIIWPYIGTKGLVYSSPALADIDGATDNHLEIVCGSYDNKVYIWNTNRSLLTGWPQETRGCVLGSPVVADVDGDNKPEIIVGSSGRKVYIWNDDGTLLEGWPKTLTTNIYSSPAVGDLDGDGRISIVIAEFNGNVYQWELSYDASESTYTNDWKMFGRDASRCSWVE